MSRPKISTLAEKLNNIVTPACIHCTDVHCEAHTIELEDYTMEVLEAVESAAGECLPVSGGGNSSNFTVTPGWSEYVKPFCEESKFWFSVWQSAGHPTGGDLYNVMKNSKLQYKYAVRRLKRANNRIQNDKFVEGIIHGGKNIFSEIKKFRGTTKTCRCIDRDFFPLEASSQGGYLTPGS